MSHNTAKGHILPEVDNAGRRKHAVFSLLVPVKDAAAAKDGKLEKF